MIGIRAARVGVSAALAVMGAALAPARAGVPCPFPVPTSYVTDRANLLSTAERERIDAKLKSLDRPDTAAMAVYVVPELPKGAAIDAVGLACAKSWGVGYAGKDNGVVLLIAYAERSTRLDVGIGLEHALTNEACRKILRDIRPALRAGRYEAGIDAAIDAVYARIGRRAETSAKASSTFDVPLGYSDQGFTYEEDGSLTFDGQPFSPGVTFRTDSIPKVRISRAPDVRNAAAIGLDVDGQNTLFVLDLASRESVSAQGPGRLWSAAQSVFWSPSGGYLLAACYNEEQWFISVDLGAGTVLHGGFLKPSPSSPRRWVLGGAPRWNGQEDVLTVPVNEVCDPFVEGASCGSGPQEIYSRRDLEIDARTLSVQAQAPGPGSDAESKTLPEAHIPGIVGFPAVTASPIEGGPHGP